MAQRTKALTARLRALPLNDSGTWIKRLALPLALGAILWWPSQHGYWWLSAVLITAAELVTGPTDVPWRKRLLSRLPAILMAASLALSISLLVKALSQLVLVMIYVAWRVYYGGQQDKTDRALIGVLLAQIAFFEAAFLAAAVLGLTPAGVLVLVWLGCFGLSYAMLQARGDRNAMLMASVWALVAAECSWVFTTWLVSYVTVGGYVIVPQPTLVLSAIAYCFGGIYLSQQQNRLSRARLSEYLFIALVIVAIVISGTTWRGTL